MAKFTMFLGLLFVINTIGLSIFYTKHADKSVMDTTTIKEKESPKLNPLENNLNIDSSLVPLAPINKEGVK